MCVGFDVPYLAQTRAHAEKTYYYPLCVGQLRSFQGLTMTNIVLLVHPYDAIVARVSAFKASKRHRGVQEQQATA